MVSDTGNFLLPVIFSRVTIVVFDILLIPWIRYHGISKISKTTMVTREERWAVLISRGILRKDVHTGGAWLSSARVVRCWVESRNERNPRP